MRWWCGGARSTRSKKSRKTKDQQNLELGGYECRNDGFYIPSESISNDYYFKSYVVGGCYHRYCTSWCCPGLSWKVVPLICCTLLHNTHTYNFQIFCRGFCRICRSFFYCLYHWLFERHGPLWPIEFDIWKASMSLCNAHLHSRPHIRLRGRNPMLVGLFADVNTWDESDWFESSGVGLG